jgi:type IV secretion system protein VirD4
MDRPSVCACLRKNGGAAVAISQAHAVLMQVKAYLPVVKLYAPYVTWGLLGIAVLAMLLRGAGRRSGRRKDARWASRHGLRKAWLLGEVGIVLGRIGGLILRYWGRGHVFVVAATQSGKSGSLVTPTCLEKQPRRGPKVTMIMNDPKDDLYEATATFRRTISRVIHLAPMDSTTDHYNPLDAIRLGTVHETADMQLLEKILVNPEGKPITTEASQHYVDMTETVVGGLTVYGLLTGMATSLGEFYVHTTQGELDKIFEQMSKFDHPRVREAAELLRGLDSQQYAGLVSTLKRVFRLYGDPQIGEMVSYSDFALSDLRQGPEPLSVYLSIPFQHLERCRPLTCLLFQQWLGHCTEAPRRWRKLGWHRVLGMGEEFPSLKHLNIAHDIMNQGAGLGVQLCLITPSLNDIEAIWGTHHNFLDNAHVQVFFGITDERVAERISRRLGTHTVTKRRVSWSGGRRTVSTEDVQEPLMTVSDITHMDPNDVIVLARDQQVIAQQTPWGDCEPWASRGVAL